MLGALAARWLAVSLPSWISIIGINGKRMWLGQSNGSARMNIKALERTIVIVIPALSPIVKKEAMMDIKIVELK